MFSENNSATTINKKVGKDSKNNDEKAEEINESDLTIAATLPKVTLPQKYMLGSMPARGVYHSEKLLLYHAYQGDEGHFINSDENLIISQPLPNTVKIVNEQPNIGRKDSCWLGCFMACLLCFAVKERS